MSDDSLETEVARLFEACRAEQPSESARRRVLAGAPQAAPLRSRWTGPAFVLVAASVILAVGLYVRREPAPNIGAEELVVTPAHGVEAVVTPKQEHPLEPSPVTSSPAPNAKSVPKPPRPPAPLTLEEETQSLERARAALRAGEPRTALAELDAYQKAARGGSLALEATLLRIQALASAGHATEASALAARFVAANPNSPLVERARRYLAPSVVGEPKPVESTEGNGRNDP